MKSLFLVVVIVQGLSLKAFAGPITSGGGFAVVCRNQNTEIISAELLDLYEAKNKFNYTIISSSGNLEDDMIAATININRLQGYTVSPSHNDIAITLNEFFKKVNFLPKTSQLPNLNDLGEHAQVPKDCKIEPLAVWNDQHGEIKINTEIWNHLTTLDQSALINHENFYWYERTHLNQTTSENTRAVIAISYSTNAKEVVNNETRTLPNAYARGINQGVIQFRFEKQENLMTLYFTRLLDFILLTEAKATIDLTNIEFRNVKDLRTNEDKVIALTNETKVIRSKIQTSQNKNWEIEFTFIPNTPVKVGLYQKNILIKELDLSHIDL